MSIDPTRNFAKVRVSTTYNSSATSIVLISGDGAKLPDPSTNGSFNLTWFNITNYPDPSDDPLVEIVRVTNISGDTLTVVRGQENTTASNKNTASVTYIMILAPTKKTIDDLQKFTIATDQTDFSSQSFQNILKNGDFESWSSGITSAPNGWVLGSGSSILADSTNKKMGTYGASITSPTSAQGYIYQSISDLTYFKGRSITIGGWIKISTAARVCIYIQDGVSYAQSPYHTGSGSWELLTLPFAVSGSATELTVFCMIVTGTSTTASFDGMILVEGSVVPAFSPRPLYDDGKTLTIDSLNNRIGIKNASPSEALDITGNIAITGTVDGVDISAHNTATTGVHGVGGDTIDGVSARNTAISTHSSVTSSVHGFNSSGDAPAQTHGISRHTGTIGDHAANLSSIGTNTHAAIDTAIGTTLPGLVTTHAALTTAHGSTSAATISAIMQRDASGRAKVAAPSATDDIAIKGTVDTHAGLTTTHGVSGAIVGTTDTQTLSGKTLTTPTIGSFINANHTHAAADATGGIVDHTNLANKGSNTHAQIDTALTASAGHIAASGTSVHSLGTMSTQSAGSVTITGGSISGITDLAVADGGTGASTITGIVKGNGTSAFSAAAAGTDFVAPNSAITGATNTKITYDAKGLVTAGTTATLASADFANQGTTTTLLHGNASGNPSWGAVTTSDISSKNVTYAKIQDVSATDKVLGRQSAGAGIIEEIPCTPAARSLLASIDAAAQRTTMGLDTMSTQPASNVTITGGSISGLSSLGISGNVTVTGTVDGIDVSTIPTMIATHAGEEASTFLSFTEVDPGSTITVTASKVNVVAETTGASRVYKTLSRTLTDFSFNFELYFTTWGGDGAGESGAAVVLLGDSTDQITWSTWGSNNGVSAFLNKSSDNIPGICPVKYVAGTRYSGTVITLALATQYYCTLSRSSTILTVSVFSDAARTTHISGSPQTQTVVTTAWDKLNVCNNSTTYNYTHTYYIQNLAGYSVHDLGTMSTQYANNVTITGGSITNISLLQSAGSFSLPIVNKTGAYTATANDHTITCDATSGTFTITLPAAAGITGRIYIIKKIDSSGNAITIDANASETIDGTVTKSLNFQYESITIQSNGTNWYIL